MPRVESSHTPSLGRGSAARSVLAIPELLQTIFSFGTQVSNVSNAFVCRSWSGPALDYVWHEVELYDLLRLLVPLRLARKHYVYVRRPIITVLSCSLLRGSLTISRPQKTGRVLSLLLAACVLSKSRAR